MRVNRRVLVTEDNEDAREMLAEGLSAAGAVVATAASGEEAIALAVDFRPEVLVLDLHMRGGIDGYETLAALRAAMGADVPAVALSGLASTDDRTRSIAAGFAKHLAKPARLADIVAAVHALADPKDAATDSLRTIVVAVNDAADCRYTSVLRFGEDGRLVSLWTHDRSAPTIDPFPLALPIEASYCRLVRDGDGPIAIEDAMSDLRVASHAKRLELARYIGAPLRTADGRMLGTLCSYDAEARTVPAALRELHDIAARRLGPLLGPFFERPSHAS